MWQELFEGLHLPPSWIAGMRNGELHVSSPESKALAANAARRKNDERGLAVFARNANGSGDGLLKLVSLTDRACLVTQ
jgi:hypothetical protein